MENSRKWSWPDSRNIYPIMAAILVVAAIGFFSRFVTPGHKNASAISAAKSKTGLVVGEIRVEKGQTLSQIARNFGTTVPYLVELNGLKNPDRILEGQILRVVYYYCPPKQKSRLTGRDFQGPAAEPHRVPPRFFYLVFT